MVWLDRKISHYRKKGSGKLSRQPNIKINAELLDKQIKSLEGDKFDPKKVSEFIMSRGDTYYSKSIKDGAMALDALEKLCKYYDLDKKDYIITDQQEKQEVQKQVDNTNYENMLIAFGNVDKLLREILAQQKSTNYILGELRNNLIISNKNQKDIVNKLEAIEKRQNRYGKY